jgi:hypothetical protein
VSDEAWLGGDGASGPAVAFIPADPNTGSPSPAQATRRLSDGQKRAASDGAVAGSDSGSSSGGDGGVSFSPSDDDSGGDEGGCIRRGSWSRWSCRAVYRRWQRWRHISMPFDWLLVLLFGLFVAVSVCLISYQNEVDWYRKAVAEECHARARAVSDASNRVFDTVTGYAGLFASSAPATKEQFFSYVRLVGIGARHLFTLSWHPHVRHDQRQRFEDDISKLVTPQLPNSPTPQLRLSLSPTNAWENVCSTIRVLRSQNFLRRIR